MPNSLQLSIELGRQLEALTGADHWYVGFSGGLDSTVLLHLISRWASDNAAAPTLTAVHVNHSLQAEADQWQRHCENVCGQLGVEIVCQQVQVVEQGRGIESAARDSRYQCFTELLSDSDVLYLGHHLDDQVETFFLRLMRGAGVQGLAGMPGERALGPGRLVRPLLSMSRQQLEEYALQQSLTYIEDPSNQDDGLDRNYLRNQVLPLLDGRWPGYRNAVARASGHLSRVAGSLSATLAAPNTCHNDWGDVGFVADDLSGDPQDAMAQIRGWLRDQACQMPDLSSLQEFTRQLLQGGGDSKARLDCGVYALQRYRGAIYLLPADGPWQAPAGVALLPGDAVVLPGVGTVTLEPTMGPGLMLAEAESVTLSSRQGGERCQIAGKAHSSSLKQLLQEAGVPPWWRARVPLLYRGEILLAIGGLALCQTDYLREQPPAGEKNWKLCWNPDSSASEV
ncbi:MAG: tRNA lysidine(34) synthetase TilS [Halioglobus sp.]